MTPDPKYRDLCEQRDPTLAALNREAADLRAQLAGADEDLRRHGDALAKVVGERDAAVARELALGVRLGKELDAAVSLRARLTEAEEEVQAARSDAAYLSRQCDAAATLLGSWLADWRDPGDDGTVAALAEATRAWLGENTHTEEDGHGERDAGDRAAEGNGAGSGRGSGGVRDAAERERVVREGDDPADARRSGEGHDGGRRGGDAARLRGAAEDRAFVAPPPAPGAGEARCALCGRPALGFAAVGPSLERLCHHETRDCYHRWTVYGQRPHHASFAPFGVGCERFPTPPAEEGAHGD